MGLKIKLVKIIGLSFLISFRSYCGSVSLCIIMCDLIFIGNFNLFVYILLLTYKRIDFEDGFFWFKVIIYI